MNIGTDKKLSDIVFKKTTTEILDWNNVENYKNSYYSDDYYNSLAIFWLCLITSLLTIPMSGTFKYILYIFSVPFMCVSLIKAFKSHKEIKEEKKHNKKVEDIFNRLIYLEKENKILDPITKIECPASADDLNKMISNLVIDK